MSGKWEIGELVENRYQIHQLKKGGMGIVFLCYDQQDNMPVALKTFQDQFLMDNRSIERFINEASAWIHLERHPNIVRAYRVETIMFRPYLVLEYITGDDYYGLELDQWIRRNGLNIRLVLNFAVQICQGMVHARQVFEGMGQVFVHQDLKPRNILITRDRVVKITDFGLTKVFDDHGLSIGYGTPEYMAPEQFMGSADVDSHADIYAFGCVLYEMVCGHTPFVVPNDLTSDERRNYFNKLHLEELPSEPRKTNPICPEALNKLIIKCMSKKPAERYQDFRIIEVELRALYHDYTGEDLGFFEQGLIKQLDFQEITQKGVSLYSLGRYPEALACFNHVLATNDQDDYNYYLLIFRGSVFDQLGDLTQALQDYNQAILQHPDQPEAYCLRANLYNNLGEGEQAIRNYNQAIALDSKYSIAYYNRGLCYLRNESNEKALADFDIAIELGFWEAYTNRGAANQKIGNRRQALEDYLKAIELNPRDAIAYANLGAIYEKGLDRPDEAMEYYNTALLINPYYILAYFFRASLLAAIGRLEEAIADYERALAIDPGDIHRVTSTVYAMTVPDLKTVYQIINHDCGVAFLKMERFTEARRYFLDFLKLATAEFDSETSRVNDIVKQLDMMIDN